MTAYPVEFHRRSEQRWARRAQEVGASDTKTNLRMPVRRVTGPTVSERTCSSTCCSIEPRAHGPSPRKSADVKFPGSRAPDRATQGRERPDAGQAHNRGFQRIGGRGFGPDQQLPSWVMSDPEHSSTAQNKDSVMYYVTTSYDYCINGIKNSDVKKWFEKKKIFSFEETRFALMNKTFEHQTHHRGQTTIYIRLQGIKPPQERLF